jgi:hypothetical protein
MNLEALLKVMFPDYNGEFYPTGSEVYGYSNELSDYDFMVLSPEGIGMPENKVRNEIIKRLEELQIEIEHSQYFNCIKFNLLDKKINLVFLNDKNYSAWMSATKVLKALKKFHEDQLMPYNCLADKRLRCILFQQMVTEFGGDDVGLVYENHLFCVNEPAASSPS